jgi:hypothetical protein
MKRSKQTARRSVSNADNESLFHKLTKRNKLLKQHQWKFAYVMIRLIDIRDKLDVQHITADNILDKLYIGDIYNLFGQANDINADSHIVVGVEARRYNCDRLDAYVLVGLKVMEETNLNYTSDVALSIDAALCKEGCTLNVCEDSYYVMYADETQAKWCMNIIKDMEDKAEDGNMSFVL